MLSSRPVLIGRGLATQTLNQNHKHPHKGVRHTHTIASTQSRPHKTPDHRGFSGVHGRPRHTGTPCVELRRP